MNAVFFPQAVLDILVAIERVDVEGEQLVLTEEGLRYEVLEAARIIEEVTTGEDPHDLLGKVVSLEELVTKHAAELLGSSMIIEDSAYDIVPGMLAQPAGEASPATPEQDLLAALQTLDDVREALA